MVPWSPDAGSTVPLAAVSVTGVWSPVVFRPALAGGVVGFGGVCFFIWTGVAVDATGADADWAGDDPPAASFGRLLLRVDVVGMLVLVSS